MIRDPSWIYIIYIQGSLFPWIQKFYCLTRTQSILTCAFYWVYKTKCLYNNRTKYASCCQTLKKIYFSGLFFCKIYSIRVWVFVINSDMHFSVQFSIVAQMFTVQKLHKSLEENLFGSNDFIQFTGSCLLIRIRTMY